MIPAHQSTIFGPNVLCAFSSRSDGTMLERSKGRLTEPGLSNRRAFAESAGVNYDDVVYQIMAYFEGATYKQIAVVDERSTTEHEPGGVQADTLITTTPGVYLMLPVADCVATALYDPEARVIASLHLGRHNSIARSAEAAVERLVADFGARPERLQAWLSPSVGADSYPMDHFAPAHEPELQDFATERDGKVWLDLPGFNRSRLLAAGLSAEHIQVAGVDVYASDEYFSHSRGDTDGRMVMLVGMRN